MSQEEDTNTSLIVLFLVWCLLYLSTSFHWLRGKSMAVSEEGEGNLSTSFPKVEIGGKE